MYIHSGYVWTSIIMCMGIAAASEEAAAAFAFGLRSHLRTGRCRLRVSGSVASCRTRAGAKVLKLKR